MVDPIKSGITKDNLLQQVAEIVSAYLSNNALSASALPMLIVETHRALRSLPDANVSPVVEELRPAVPIRKSVTPDFIVCLDDGKVFKSLKRHLASLGMTPDEYRAKWALPGDYPMVAPNYTAIRSAMAISNGLGRKAATQGSPQDGSTGGRPLPEGMREGQ